MDIVCFSHLRWDFVFQRPQHLLTRFARHGRVFYVEEPVYDAGEDHTEIRVRNGNVTIVTPHLRSGPNTASCITGQRDQLSRLWSNYHIRDFGLWYGYPLNVTMYEYLLSNGMTKDEYDWFTQNQVKAHCIMGNDYYVTNEHLVHPDGSTQASGEIFGYYVITHQYYKRYRLPIMHTETNIRMPACREWLLKQWANVHRLKHDGVPIVGFTWYSLLHQVDWDTALREDNGTINELGLYDLNRQIMPVGRAYRELIANWKDIIEEESYGMIFHNW